MGVEYNLHDCTLCPRECHADRASGMRGLCGCDDGIYVSRAALHQWEEPCISGTKGSGTIFFSGCVLGCIYCQNREIALGDSGIEITEEVLTALPKSAWSLWNAGRTT